MWSEIKEKEEIYMKKCFGKCVYDTEKATVVKRKTCGAFGDPAGYEEVLYQTASGSYFLYVNGGEASPHPSEDILRMTKDKAAKFLGE